MNEGRARACPHWEGGAHSLLLMATTTPTPGATRYDKSHPFIVRARTMMDRLYAVRLNHEAEVIDATADRLLRGPRTGHGAADPDEIVLLDMAITARALEQLLESAEQSIAYARAHQEAELRQMSERAKHRPQWDGLVPARRMLVRGDLRVLEASIVALRDTYTHAHAHSTELFDLMWKCERYLNPVIAWGEIAVVRDFVDKSTARVAELAAIVPAAYHLMAINGLWRVADAMRCIEAKTRADGRFVAAWETMSSALDVHDAVRARTPTLTVAEADAMLAAVDALEERVAGLARLLA